MGAHTPEQLHELFAETVNNKDIEGLLALYDKSCLTADLEGKQVQGEASLRAFLEALLDTISHIEGTTRKVLVNGDVALLSTAWTASVNTPAGPQIATGTTGEVARKQADGIWRFVIDDPQFVP
ncbi:YybH family protein [Nocardia gipuzkoensis]|uniref:YybH family protein n=1 Tax=Nocardia gipuzkoensis TaxID=2749991 RepID=UPI00237EE313|nr:nuclear transport factor 2 family protein [Nocardia gipuzkoensis]MDE1675303.1 nuclear transport factor 2 family protein [Nocardia gipuzkoensis]